MSTSTRPFSIVTFQDGSLAVVLATRARAFWKSSRSSPTPHAPETTPTEKTAALLSPQVSRRHRQQPPSNTLSSELKSQPS